LNVSLAVVVKAAVNVELTACVIAAFRVYLIVDFKAAGDTTPILELSTTRHGFNIREVKTLRPGVASR
jgi:hypothetical protein